MDLFVGTDTFLFVLTNMKPSSFAYLTSQGGYKEHRTLMKRMISTRQLSRNKLFLNTPKAPLTIHKRFFTVAD